MAGPTPAGRSDNNQQLTTTRRSSAAFCSSSSCSRCRCRRRAATKQPPARAASTTTTTATGAAMAAAGTPPPPPPPSAAAALGAAPPSAAPPAAGAPSGAGPAAGGAQSGRVGWLRRQLTSSSVHRKKGRLVGTGPHKGGLPGRMTRRRRLVRLAQEAGRVPLRSFRSSQLQNVQGGEKQRSIVSQGSWGLGTALEACKPCRGGAQAACRTCRQCICQQQGGAGLLNSSSSSAHKASAIGKAPLVPQDSGSVPAGQANGQRGRVGKRGPSGFSQSCCCCGGPVNSAAV